MALGPAGGLGRAHLIPIGRRIGIYSDNLLSIRIPPLSGLSGEGSILRRNPYTGWIHQNFITVNEL